MICIYNMEGPAYDPNKYAPISKYRKDNATMTQGKIARSLRGTGLWRLWKKYIGCNTLGVVESVETAAKAKKRDACHHLKNAYWGPINTWLGRGNALQQVHSSGGVDVDDLGRVDVGGSRRAARKGGTRRARNRCSARR